MKKVIMAIVVIVILGACAAGCTSGNGEVSSSSSSTVSTATESVAPTSGVGGVGFTWQPDLGHDYGSDVANRSASGILDGDGSTLYFQAPNGSNGPLYSLYALNEATGEIEELVADCYGMINVIGDAVFYIGEVDQGVFRYDLRSKSASKLYDGVVQNLLATKDYVYMVNGANELVQITLASGEKTKVSDSVARHYLEYVDGYVYFAQLNPDEMNCNVCKVADGSPEKVSKVYDNIAYPMDMVGTRVLYSDDTGVHLIDVNTKKESTVYGREIRAGIPAANGNGVFYATTDDEGYAELSVFDVNSGKTSMLMPVHGGTIYFVDGEIFLVNPVNFDIERVILDANDPRTELVLKGDSQAR